MIDLDLVRAETPACERRVFLDSAGSSLPPECVVAAVVSHLRREAEVGGYVAANERAADLVGLKVSLGRLLGCGPESVALMDSATRAWTQFFHAVPFQAGDRILISEAEYASNAIAALQRARMCGAQVEIVPSDDTGQINLSALAAMLDERVRLVSLVHVPTNGGLINPVRAVVDLAHRHGALVLLDACQSVGQLRVDVEELQVDALSGTGRKWLRGPRGTGFLYVRPALVTALEPPVIDLQSATWQDPFRYELRDDATRFELWEFDVAGRLGLRCAVDYLLNLGLDDVQRAVLHNAEQLRRSLSSIPRVQLHDIGRTRCGIVSFTIDGIDPAEVRDALAGEAITVTVSGRASTLLDMSMRNLHSVVRASPHYFVSAAQLDLAADAVARLSSGGSRTHQASAERLG